MLESLKNEDLWLKFRTFQLITGRKVDKTFSVLKFEVYLWKKNRHFQRKQTPFGNRFVLFKTQISIKAFLSRKFSTSSGRWAVEWVDGCIGRQSNSQHDLCTDTEKLPVPIR